jgi:hypothetical protein
MRHGSNGDPQVETPRASSSLPPAPEGRAAAAISLAAVRTPPGESYLLCVARTRLVWKWEEGFEKVETAVGPAWLDTLDDDGRRTSTEEVANGEWIARDEAIRLAHENDHDLLLDE